MKIMEMCIISVRDDLRMLEKSNGTRITIIFANLSRVRKVSMIRKS